MRSSKSTAKRQLQLEVYAAAHRAYPTRSEALLWRGLRCRQLGVEFKRQVPLGGFIVDFLAPVARLVVEVDGGYHRQCRARDLRKERRLQKLGYRVLRIEAALVEGNPAAAVAVVAAALSAS